MQNILDNELQHCIRLQSTGELSREQTTMVTPRVLLADDQEDMLETVFLSLVDEFNIVGTAENGTRAVELAMKLSPDVLVLDISMPKINGIQAAWRLKELGSRVRVVFLTVHADPDFVEAALSAGALGYVLKPSLATDLIPAIRAVLKGSTFISPSMRTPLP
jgi:DNA-binding NarL/FixJ family response regulator